MVNTTVGPERKTFFFGKKREKKSRAICTTGHQAKRSSRLLGWWTRRVVESLRSTSNSSHVFQTLLRCIFAVWIIEHRATRQEANNFAFTFRQPSPNPNAELTVSASAKYYHSHVCLSIRGLRFRNEKERKSSSSTIRPMHERKLTRKAVSGRTSPHRQFLSE